MLQVVVKRKSFMHVFWTCIFVIVVLLASATVIYAAELTEYAEISITSKNGEKYNEMQLLDGRYTTKITLSDTTEISIGTQEKIYGLYIIWDKPPGYWSLQADEGIRTSMYLNGKNGFIHEYVELKVPSSSICIVTPNTGAQICEVRVFGDGVLPDSVQAWNEPYKDADMLLISTHADDEHLFFGGTMPYYSRELDYKVQIAYLTNHWAEPYRMHELLNGLWTVGMTAYPVISEFTDYYSDNLEHAKNLYDIDEVFAYEVGLLRRFKPEVVIGHDVNGEYGHGVHMLNTWVLQQAIELAADDTYLSQQVSDYGSFAVSKVYLHLYEENSILMDWNIPLESFGGKTALQMAELGFAEHVSQQEWFSVRTDGIYDCRAFGLYYTSVGLDSGKQIPDFFENVDAFSDDPIVEPAEDNGTIDESSNSEEFWGDFLTRPGIKSAAMILGALLSIFIVFILWGRNRAKR